MNTNQLNPSSSRDADSETLRFKKGSLCQSISVETNGLGRIVIVDSESDADYWLEKYSIPATSATLEYCRNVYLIPNDGAVIFDEITNESITTHTVYSDGREDNNTQESTNV